MEKTQYEQLNQWGRKTFENCTRYIDSSKAVLQHYQSKRIWGGQEKHIHKINGWLEEDTSQALVFRTTAGCGMKTILGEWERGVRQANRTKKEKVLTITHFASAGSNDSNCYYSLYQIIIKLKEALHLKQNVDLLQENIRKFFPYWLDIASSEVEKQLVVYCAQQIYHKIVIVIEAVDRFIDQETGKEANLAFWLPEHFPKNVKVIVTARKHSESIQHLERIGCEIVDVRPDQGIAASIHEVAQNKESILSKEAETAYKGILKELLTKVVKTHNSYSYIEFFAGAFLPKQAPKEWVEALESKINKAELAKSANINQLYQFVLESSTEQASLRHKFELALAFMTLSQKGLTTREMQVLTKLTEKEWDLFLAIFGCLIVKYEGVYSIRGGWLTEAVLQREKRKKGEDFVNKVMGWHQRIARVLEATDNSIRKLQQQAYHLFCARNYFKLKGMVSNIQNFLLLFNPHNKYELSRYWQKLQQKGFDPVIEYNKEVQRFSMHYHPSDQNIFNIIVQISKFLKEFCDFETYDTPTFRHPHIEGNMLELRKIGLLGELANLDIYFDNSFNPPESIEQPEMTVSEQIKELVEKYFPKEVERNVQVAVGLAKAAQGEAPSHNRPKKKSESPKILTEIEQLNVDVPMNRDKFRQEYLKRISQFMKKQQQGCVFGRTEGGYLDIDESSVPTSVHKHALSTLSFQKIKQNYRLHEVKPSLYYYKRWIWIQFPWVCISMNSNYSTTPQLRKKIEGDDSQNLEQEYRYTKQCLLMAVEARQKKEQMFNKKPIENNSRGFSRTKQNVFTITKHSSSVRTQGLASPKAITSSMPTLDLSLQALSKELQARRAGSKEQQRVLLGQIRQNCEQEMKFISLRKQFKSPPTCGEMNEVLPQVKWAIKQHTNYEMQFIKNHIEEKKKSLNKVIYENKKLAEVYRQLRIKEALTKKSLQQREEEKVGRKSRALDDLYQRKEEVIGEFCRSLLQKERLRIILKLCSENKTRNEEYLASLNYFLVNLKKMIAIEKENMKHTLYELQEKRASVQNKVSLEQERGKNRHVVEQQVERYLNEKGRLEAQIEGIEQSVWEDIQDQKDRMQNSLTGHLRHKQEKNQIKEQEKTIKQLQERYDRACQDYSRARDLFDLDQNGEPGQRMQSLLEQNQRNKQLKITYFERRNKLEQLQRELSRVREENERELRREMKRMGGVKVEKKSKEYRQTTNERKLQILLDNICLKLGVKDKSEIVPLLKKKMQHVTHQPKIVLSHQT